MLTKENESAHWLMVVAVVAITLVAIVGLAASIAGFAFNHLRAPSRLVMLVLSLAIFFTRLNGVELLIQLIAAVLVAGILVLNFRTRASGTPETVQT